MITLYKLLTNATAYELDAAATPKVAIIGGTTNDAPPVSIADAPDTAKPAPITNDNVIVQHISLSVGKKYPNTVLPIVPFKDSMYLIVV